MHKTIYIEADEEITSVIDRIRKEGSPDIFIVVPKNAMLVQGVINLKLLKKEAAKMKKNIILVTNDKQAKKVIGRIGFEIKEALSAEEMQDVSPKEPLGEVEQASMESLEELDKQEKRSSSQREIGSSSFFADKEENEFSNEKDDYEQENSPDFSPERVIKKMDMVKNQEANLIEEQKNKAEIAVKRRKEVEEIFEEDIDFEEDAPRGAFSNQKAEQFFTKSDTANNEKFSKKSFKKKKPIKKASGRKINYLFIVLLFLILAFIGFGGWAYFNWPQMSVVVYPKEKNVSSVVDVEVIDGLNNSDIEKRELAGKMEEFEIEKTLEFEATGEKYSSDQGKARGKVTIYNKYSSSDQPLVATTRVLSEEGKLFRLINSVTVPGMEDDEPGKIEVSVIADQPGEDFNIDATTFTIEGFKGNPKYEKFEVASKDSMSGGSDSSENSLVNYVTSSDIENARLETLDAIEKSFEQEMESNLNNLKGYILDSAKKEVVENKSSFEVEEITDKFNYTIKQKVKLITFSKEELLAVAKNSLAEELDLGYDIDESELKTEIIKEVTDFDEKTMSLRINVSGIAWPKIDKDNFKKGIADQNEEEFENILKNYQEIKKVDIEYSPGWLSGIAVSEKKIKIEEERAIFEE